MFLINISIIIIMTEIISFTIKNTLREQIDELRGDVSRSRFINKILETEVENRILDKNMDVVIEKTVSNDNHSGMEW